MIEIDISAAEAALHQQERNFGGPFGLAESSGAHDHAGKPRRQRQLPQLPPPIGNAPIAPDRPQCRHCEA